MQIAVSRAVTSSDTCLQPSTLDDVIAAATGPQVWEPIRDVPVKLASPADGCSPLTTTNLFASGGLLLVERGRCNFATKGYHGEQAGASAVVRALSIYFYFLKRFWAGVATINLFPCPRFYPRTPPRSPFSDACLPAALVAR